MTDNRLEILRETSTSALVGGAMYLNYLADVAFQNRGDMSTSFTERMARVRMGSADVRDMIYVGWCLIHGEEVQHDVDQGLHWLNEASRAGSGEAKVRLAEIFESGYVVPQDCETARKFYAEAIEGPGFHGPYGYALANYHGSKCISQDLSVALRFFRTAADRGHLVSRVAVARIYRSGAFGAAKKFLGCLLVVPIAIAAMWHVLRKDPCDALWDAGRWLPNTRIVSHIRRGTRFE